MPFNRLSILDGSLTLLAENPGLAELVANSADAGVEKLSAAERKQLTAYQERVVSNQQWTFNELPREELPVRTWRRISREGSWQACWKELKDELRPEFVEWMEANVIGK
jgi:hypothetical protein